jgi:hypothetical protein
MEFELAGHVRLTSSVADPAVRRAIAAEMDPYLPLAAADDDGTVGVRVLPRVALAELSTGEPAITELQLAAGDGFVTGSTDAVAYMLAGGLRASVPDALADDPASVRFDPGFPVRRLFRQIVRPALQLRALAAGSVAVHSAAVELDGAAILVAGWSESGKTETALAFAETGARFISDKWTLVAGGGDADGAPEATAAPFPINVGVRRWVLRYLPRLRDALPTRARAQLAAAGVAAAASSPIRGRRRLRGLAALVHDGAERAIALADRVGLAPSEVAAAYGHAPFRERLPIRLIVVLRTVPGTELSAASGDADRLSRRLAVSAVTERHAYHALRQRTAYATGAPADPAAAAALETERLRALLGAVPIVEVSAPFPTDPRRIVAAVAPWLDGRP